MLKEIRAALKNEGEYAGIVNGHKVEITLEGNSAEVTIDDDIFEVTTWAEVAEELAYL